jgi:hypothetical protein
MPADSEKAMSGIREFTGFRALENPVKPSLDPLRGLGIR